MGASSASLVGRVSPLRAPRLAAFALQALKITIFWLPVNLRAGNPVVEG
jgi:hypothetical protein